MTHAGRTPRLLLRALLTVTLAALVAALAAAPGGAARRPAPRSRQAAVLPYEAELVSCRRSPRTEVRTAIVGAEMRPVAGGERLALRVDLFQRPLAGGRWALRSDVPGLGVWTTPSDPTIGTRPRDVFKYRQAVGRLVVPFAYRFRVSFRWSGADGAVVREAAATTAQCREPDLRADLVLARAWMEAEDGAGRDEDGAHYRVVVRNAGRTPVTAAEVAASYPGATRTIRRLVPRDSVELRFAGPACDPDAPPTFTVDPANLVEEGSESNNSLAVTCPATLDRP